MIIGFVLVLCILGVALSLSIYANLLPFIGTIGDIKQYNMAYYGAQSALERSLLVLRYQEAGFEGDGGRLADVDRGPVSDSNLNFGQFVSAGNELYWKIIGRGVQVPLSGLGNIEPSFLSDPTNDYNALHYKVFDAIPVGYDSTTGSLAYVADNQHFSNTGVSVSAFFRLNPLIYNVFGQSVSNGDLCSNGCDVDGDGTDDDIAVDRGWKGLYTDGSSSGSFSIFPYQHVANTAGIGSVLGDDEGVRESLLSDDSTELLRFGSSNNDFNPILGRTNNSSHLIVTDNDTLSGISFTNMLSSSGLPDFLSQQLTLSLINPLYSQQGSLYPFLEYRVVCNGCGTQSGQPQLAQPYFYITAQSKIGDYNVTMQLIRSSNKNSLISSFTVIF